MSPSTHKRGVRTRTAVATPTPDKTSASPIIERERDDVDSASFSIS